LQLRSWSNAFTANSQVIDLARDELSAVYNKSRRTPSILHVWEADAEQADRAAMRDKHHITATGDFSLS